MTKAEDLCLSAISNSRFNYIFLHHPIGDEQLPDDGVKNGQWPEWLQQGKARTSGRFTFTTYKHYKKDSPLLPSGLTGPVSIKEMSTD